MWHGDWKSVQPSGDYARPEPDGYVAVICGVQDVEKKEYLEIRWDFTEEPFRGANRSTFDRFGWWPTLMRRSYKESARGMFRAFLTAVEGSNPGYEFDSHNLQALNGKRLGVVLGEEEYPKKDGSIGKRLVVSAVKTVQQIYDGDFKVPALKKLSGGSYGSTYGGSSASYNPSSASGSYAGSYGGNPEIPDFNSEDVPF